MSRNSEPPIQLHPDLSYRDLVAFINENFRKAFNNEVNYAQKKGTKYSYTGASLPATIVDVSIKTTGNPVQVICSGDANPLSAGGWGTVNLYRGTTAIGQKIQFEASAANENNPYCISVIDTPPPGTYTYSLKIVDNSGGNVDFGESAGPVISVVEL